jgi:predicted metalloprotease with PDZ domain
VAAFFWLMISYNISAGNPSQHIFEIVMRVPVNNRKQLNLQLPAWRPGRYELANFAKNIISFDPTDEMGVHLNFRKITKDLWEIEVEGLAFVKIKYSYYSNELNAGSTYVDSLQWYMNPVNCLLFDTEQQMEEHEVILNFPSDYELASPIKIAANKMLAKSFDELADNPFIASNALKKKSFVEGDCEFVLWFQGPIDPDWEKVLSHFKAYTQEQISNFGSFPVKEYHYLFQITPYTHYHGVEHTQSTVITLGPANELMSTDRYLKLLGVSSHELYHTWNIKTIRPKEMLPYDFSKENYTKQGFVAEGVTTYMGDLMLYRSQVYSWEQFVATLEVNLKKHFDNFGRFNMSVADSSFDTWLDGYTLGAPNRKVSIYTEGALNMLMIDVIILQNSNCNDSLHTVMKDLYTDFALNGVGYTEVDFNNLCIKYGGEKIDSIFEKHIYGTADFLPNLKKYFNSLGLNLIFEAQIEGLEGSYGIKTNPSLSNNKMRITAIHPNSSAIQAGVAVGDYILNFDMEEGSIIVEQLFGIKTLNLVEGEFYQNPKLSKEKAPSEEQKRLFKMWSKNTF